LPEGKVITSSGGVVYADQRLDLVPCCAEDSDLPEVGPRAELDLVFLLKRDPDPKTDLGIVQVQYDVLPLSCALPRLSVNRGVEGGGKPVS